MNKEEPNGKILTYFQEVSNQFSTNYCNSGLKAHTTKIFNYFSKQDLKKINVLEIGCGVGGLLLEFLRMNANFAIGFDLSENMILNANKNAKEQNLEHKTFFQTADFNTLDFANLDIIKANKPNLIIADRVFCCTPYSIEILQKMISFNPKFIVLVLPRRNSLYRTAWRMKSKIRNAKLKINSDIPIHYYKASKLTSICEKHNFEIDFQSYRYVWETIIYKKKET